MKKHQMKHFNLRNSLKLDAVGGVAKSRCTAGLLGRLLGSLFAGGLLLGFLFGLGLGGAES